MSTIRVRRLDENGDVVYGNGINDYLTDIDAVQQIIRTSLLLWQGEWWESIEEGLPMFQQILGKNGANKILVDRLIQEKITEVPYVKNVSSFVSVFDPNDRSYQCEAIVNTDFGTVVVSGG
jgi:hypothetical protein